MSKSFKVAIVMGSQSDLPIMQKAADVLAEFGIGYELRIMSAHRTPHVALDFAENAAANGFSAIIAGAGGAAHLPGVMAGLSILPVIGVPIKSAHSIDGLDSLLSIVQMPSGVPVATVAVDGAKNAGILAAQIVGVASADVSAKLDSFKVTMKEQVEASDAQNKAVISV